jgi:hypothetical protein
MSKIFMPWTLSYAILANTSALLSKQNAQLPLYLTLNYKFACFYLVHCGLKFHNQLQVSLQLPTFLSF